MDGVELLGVSGRAPGPWVGAYLDRLLASVVNDPKRNRRDVLLGDVRRWSADPTQGGQRADPSPAEPDPHPNG